MKLFDRISTLLRADAHGVVESLEDRALLLKQCVREAKLELGQKQARRVGLNNEAEGIERDLGKIAGRMTTLDADIALAMNNGEEELARFAIKKLLPLRADERELRARLEQVREEQHKLAEVISEQEVALGELEARVRAHLAAMPAEVGDLTGGLGRGAVADEEIELELLHRRQSMGEGAA